MSNTLGVFLSKQDQSNIFMGELGLDLDSEGNRVAIFDRTSMQILFIGQSSVAKVHLNIKYANTSNLSVILFDDDLVYNAAIVDGVKLEVVDVSWN
ncbi:hypothetical protein [Shewanella sp. Arc9-LZ]|uniref:hypothetical protein n=1 Tax=Shewanella sp. Arc9-LZ TaxID=2698686 RepID=UPI00137C3472|nr:hypothetical protein [Shewanella sp. Arc9-LZ]QHS13207.1 hypothetical protein GUY17_08825 [Shewanella sp. Arc9-LZ]